MKGLLCIIVAEELYTKGSDGKTYLNPKAERDFLARWIDRLGQMMTGGVYGPGYNMYGEPIPEINLDESGVPVTDQQVDTPLSPAPSAPKRYENTVEGQYQRYFQTPEFDYVFGSGARGKEAPKDAASMQVLGNQLQAPSKDTNISSLYASQSAMGRVNQAAIQEMYKDSPDLQKWAAANPAAAQREYLKAEARRAEGMPLGKDGLNVEGDLGTGAQGEGGYDYEQMMRRRAFARKAAGLEK